MDKIVLLILSVVFTLFVLPSKLDTLAIHENSLASPTPPNQNQIGTTLESLFGSNASTTTSDPLSSFITPNASLTDSTGGDDFIQESLDRFTQEANTLNTAIETTTFTPGDGKAIDLINQASFLRGQIEQTGTGYDILHSVEQTLIDKINDSGPSSFLPSEQAYITSWVNNIMAQQELEKQQDYSSEVLPGFVN